MCRGSGKAPRIKNCTKDPEKRQYTINAQMIENKGLESRQVFRNAPYDRESAKDPEKRRGSRNASSLQNRAKVPQKRQVTKTHKYQYFSDFPSEKNSSMGEFLKFMFSPRFLMNSLISHSAFQLFSPPKNTENFVFLFQTKNRKIYKKLCYLCPAFSFEMHRATILFYFEKKK